MAVVQRLSKVARECNVGISTIVEFLHKKGIEIDMNPNTKVSEDIVELLKKEFRVDQSVKKASEELIDKLHKEKKETVSIENVHKTSNDEVEDDSLSIDELVGRSKKIDVTVVGKIDLAKSKPQEPARSGVRLLRSLLLRSGKLPSQLLSQSLWRQNQNLWQSMKRRPLNILT